MPAMLLRRAARQPPSLARLGRRYLSTASSVFRGIFPIMATPFKPDESLDVDGFPTRWVHGVDAGADGATIVGVLESRTDDRRG